MDNSSETSESQSIDINSIKINNHVPNDCESLPIDIDEIDEEEDSIALRTKRRRNQQPDDDDDENNSYEY